jgi:hypothetical protein
MELTFIFTLPAGLHYIGITLINIPGQAGVALIMLTGSLIVAIEDSVRRYVHRHLGPVMKNDTFCKLLSKKCSLAHGSSLY